MIIRRRYAKTIMESFRRSHLPQWAVWNRYHALRLTLDFGKQSPWKPWRFKK